MIEFLKTSKLFEGCTVEELHKVAELAQKVEFKFGECIFKAGSLASVIYVICDGAVELRFSVTNELAARELIVTRRFGGDAFGWSALTEHDAPYALSAFAMQDSLLLKLDAERLKDLCQKNRHLGYHLMKNTTEVIADRFGTMQNLLIEMLRKQLARDQL
ncbi:MAG: Crp/Fnr family transcriptional regulator [bacterium]